MVEELEGIALGADLAALALTFALLAWLMATRSIVSLLTDRIRNLSVAGVHFGAPLANAIDGGIDDVIDWVRGWLRAELSLLDTLLRGISWSIVETALSIQHFVHAVRNAYDRVFEQAIPDAIHGLRTEVIEWRDALSDRVHNLRTDVNGYVHTLEVSIGNLAESIPHRIDRALEGFNHEVIHPLIHRIAHAEAAIEDIILPRIENLRDRARAIEAEFASAVGTIEDVLPRIGDISFDDLNDFINRLPWRRIGTLLSLGFLTHALVRALAREAGLDRAECRRKVKGVCGTNDDAWEALLGALIGGITLMEYRELVAAAREGVDFIKDDLLQYVEEQH